MQALAVMLDVALDVHGVVIEEKPGTEIDSLGGNEEQESNQEGNGSDNNGDGDGDGGGGGDRDSNGGGGGGAGGTAKENVGKTTSDSSHDNTVANHDFLANFKLPARLQHLHPTVPNNDAHQNNADQRAQQHLATSTNGEGNPRAASSAPSYKSILIIGEMNRAGSNELMELLSTIPKSFSLYEPFRNFKYVGMLPLPGSFSTLYSCEFKDDVEMTSKVVWPGDARKATMGQLLGDYLDEGISRRGDAKLKSMPEPDYSILVNATAEVGTPFRTVWSRINATRYNFQREQTLDAASVEQVGRLCEESKVRIIKTIRFTGYVRVLPEQVKDSVKVIYMIRHPEGLLQAQEDAKKKKESATATANANARSSEPVSCGKFIYIF